MIKLLALDIDGTVANEDTKISRKVKETVAKVRKTGVHVALISGRNFNGMYNYIEELELKGIAGTCNGGEIVSIKDKKILLQEFIPFEIASDVIGASKKIGLGIINFSNLRVYTEGLDFLPDEYTIILNQKFDLVEDIIENVADYPSAKIMLVGSKKDLETLKSGICEKYKDDIHADFSTNTLLEVYSTKADKGKALDYIRDYFGYKKEETMCIGDSQNDIAMLKTAGISIAMGNALDDVKEHADFITDYVDEDGAATAMEKYLL